MIFNLSIMPVDGLSLFMLFLVAVLFPLIFVFSFAYVTRNLFRYYFVLFLTLVGILGAVLSRDLLGFYVFLEIMTVGIYFLIIDNTKKESFPAGFKYILMMFAGGLCILVATLMLKHLTGTFDIAEIARVAHTLPRNEINLILGLFVIGCLVEIGAVPFHVWLPDAHPIAPSPISALLSGIAIKVGAYGIIRILFSLQTFSSGLVVLGAVSMVFGVLLALKQTNVKRLLAYSSISQMGYILLGIGIGSGTGLGGALFHILNHATFKMLLFLCMGAVIYATRERDLRNLGGLAKRMPVTVAVFGIGALAISGIPPFNGFASKALISSAISGFFFLKPVLIITAAGTFAVFIKVFLHVFTGDTPQALKNTKEVPFLMCLSMSVLAGICLVFGIFPNLVLNKLIAPAMFSSLSFKFWNAKLFIETFMVIFLGSSIYILGMKTRLLGVEKVAQKRATTFLDYLSLDKFYCGIAAFIDATCRRIRMLLARSLNAYLLWIFLTLVVLLFVLWNL